MAHISLEEGESFAHRHDDESSTLLVAGEADLETDSGVVKLVRGQQVIIPAGQHHSVIARSSGVVLNAATPGPSRGRLISREASLQRPTEQAPRSRHGSGEARARETRARLPSQRVGRVASATAGVTACGAHMGDTA
ncbi:cupin domain-containing protein [Pedococcus dokdonensis]|uniref:cupin domain-containing protein n=1 Tax=Pedococcus dokdonensis TaxID=443156 RepID=UPI0012FDFBB3